MWMRKALVHTTSLHSHPTSLQGLDNPGRAEDLDRRARRHSQTSSEMFLNEVDCVLPPWCVAHLLDDDPTTALQSVDDPLDHVVDEGLAEEVQHVVRNDSVERTRLRPPTRLDTAQLDAVAQAERVADLSPDLDLAPVDINAQNAAMG